MCFNCGCDKPTDDMGKGHAGIDPKGKSITSKTFLTASRSQHMTVKETMSNTYTLLGKILKK